MMMDCCPCRTRRWLTPRRVDSFHHIKRSQRSHYERLARYLAGKAVGLVLSGGGARGLAHLGVLRAMTEHNIPIDYIGGTSQGSFMAAIYALTPMFHKDAMQSLTVFTTFF
jgi:predicted acylesterase/phospholipase RssA